MGVFKTVKGAVGFGDSVKPLSDEQIIKLQGQEQRNTNVANEMFANNGVDETLLAQQQKEQEGLIRWQQELDPEIVNMIHDLKCEFQSEEDGLWYPQEGTTPLCNDLLIRTMVARLRPLMSKNLMMSNYTEDRILQNIRTVNIDFAHQLGGNYTLYGVQKHNLTHILGVFKNTYEATYYRALQAGERNAMRTIHKQIEATTNNPNTMPKKKNLMGL